LPNQHSFISFNVHRGTVVTVAPLGIGPSGRKFGVRKFGVRVKTHSSQQSHLPCILLRLR
jgi:hypothetical protein